MTPNEKMKGYKMQGKTVTEKDLENILMQISIKNALLEKLNVPLSMDDFEAKFKAEFQGDKNAQIVGEESSKGEIPEETADIGECIKNLYDFGLISRNMSEKLIEKYGLQSSQNETENKAVSNFAGLEGKISDYFSKNSDLKNLIENSDVTYDASSLINIYELAKKLEERAIEGYKKEIEALKKNEIKSPKSLINSASSSGFGADKKINKKDIAKMSTEEFLKNEEIINKLMRQKML